LRADASTRKSQATRDTSTPAAGAAIPSTEGLPAEACGACQNHAAML
jgi:hypothetical protein